VKNAYIVALIVALPAMSLAQSAAKQLHFDLSKIGFVLDGEQICEDKGRLQDYPSKVMDEIIVAGPKAVPVLIAMITDARLVKTGEPIICYWYGMTVSDLALCLLADLFSDASNKRTVPGSDWAGMMDTGDKAMQAADQLHLFVKRHGRAVLQAKWQKLWARYKDQIYWDAKNRCFKLQGQ
jgi:hypothetical protein